MGKYSLKKTSVRKISMKSTGSQRKVTLKTTGKSKKKAKKGRAYHFLKNKKNCLASWLVALMLRKKVKMKKSAYRINGKVLSHNSSIFCALK